MTLVSPARAGAASRNRAQPKRLRRTVFIRDTSIIKDGRQCAEAALGGRLPPPLCSSWFHHGRRGPVAHAVAAQPPFAAEAVGCEPKLGGTGNMESSSSYDVVIVGGRPAGATLAARLGARG